jgi:thiol:disulfide interchange protein DsbD
MKRFLLFVIIFSSVFAGNAQLNPVTWSFSATKIADKTYEIHMKAIIQSGWHLYSQTSPKMQLLFLPLLLSITIHCLQKKAP